jgi:hypothetical protein
LLKDTLLDHWASTFVYLTYESATTKEFDMLGIDSLTFKHNKIDDIDIKIHFGSSINNDVEFAQLIELLQVLGQFKEMNSEMRDQILIEALTIRKGADNNLVRKLLEITQNTKEEEQENNEDSLLAHETDKGSELPQAAFAGGGV